jgi:type I restriction enzyme R subunit
MQQIIKYKNDEGNGYINTLLCFMQLFIVSNHTKTWYFANNNTQHFDIFTPILDINQCVM